MAMNKALVTQIMDALIAAAKNAERVADATHSLSRKEEYTALAAQCDQAMTCLGALREAELHCGYANYETFLVKLAIDNSRGTKTDALALAHEHGERIALADALKDYVETWTQAGKSHTLANDLIGAALGSVDWRELADELRGEVAEGVE